MNNLTYREEVNLHEAIQKSFEVVYLKQKPHVIEMILLTLIKD